MQAQAVYATQGAPLRLQVDNLLDNAKIDQVQGRVSAVIVPDANLLEGGFVSARVFQAIRQHRFKNIVVVAPSHVGHFHRINVSSLDHYHTPLGDVKINSRLRHELCDEEDDIYVGDEGHYQSHGVDAQLPFLQAVYEDFELVPIVMGQQSPDLCRQLGNALGEIMYQQDTLVVACVSIAAGSDESVDRLRELLEKADVSGLMGLLNGDSIQVEGTGALLVALIAGLRRNARSVTITDLTSPHDGSPGFLGAVISA